RDFRPGVPARFNRRSTACSLNCATHAVFTKKRPAMAKGCLAVCSGTSDVVSCETENRRKPSIATRFVPSPHRDPGMDAAAIQAGTTGLTGEWRATSNHDLPISKRTNQRRRSVEPSAVEAPGGLETEADG